ncbi:hypothetical protein FB567DRAFT_456276 [Paraphoma chrysanthemicola]|uniref:Gfd2/YDR514C-like C-terminal domain-containing protein n=1 Tax=Paraphoma chrysanthemicola TaxID=798071 RepID=A0A8K0QU06_9PLEO|nr:hypothetical protein FB567DRAFT_456276 [Paraphoma chrysanthemicola]
MEQVRKFFSNMNDSAILEYGLGVGKPNAPDLAKHIIVVVMDCEKFEFEPRCLTEYDLNNFARKEMKAALANAGPHGENLFEEIYHYHIRLLENAHYVNRKWCPGNPENNRFGVTRFATMQQAKEFLTNCISWPTDETKPDCPKCPVIFLGHTVEHEIKMLRRQLGLDASATNNVVAVIDTQIITTQKGIYGRGNKIGLASLMDKYGVACRDMHTAGNDAAYTTIGALQMVMKEILPTSPSRSLQDVIDDLEPYSMNVERDMGIPRYCTRCKRERHNRPKCRDRIQRCENCLEKGHEKAAYTHITELCIHPK